MVRSGMGFFGGYLAVFEVGTKQVVSLVKQHPTLHSPSTERAAPVPRLLSQPRVSRLLPRGAAGSLPARVAHGEVKGEA